MDDPALVEAMRDGIARFEEYRGAIPLIPQSYARLLLRKTAHFELVAMQWAPQSKSPIHDHGKSRCWVAILDGVLDVENYERLDDGLTSYARINKDSETRLMPGHLDHRLNWQELHRVGNSMDTSVFSLQLYAAPQTDYAVIDEVTMLCRRAFPEYDATFDF